MQAKNTIYSGVKTIQQNEYIYVIFKAFNPLRIPIKMTDIVVLLSDAEVVPVPHLIKIQPLQEEII